MDISDLLKMFGGQGGEPASVGIDPEKLAANPIPQAPGPQMGQGVAGMLGPVTVGDPGQGPPQPKPMPDEGSLGMPVTPPSTDNGLSGFLSHMVEKAKARDPETGMSFMDRFQRFGAQMGGDPEGAQRFSDQGAQRVKDQQDVAQRAQLQKMADDLGMSPREKLLFQANPKMWAEANKDRLGFHDIAGGNVGQYGEPGQAGSASVAPPKVGVTPSGGGYAASAEGLKSTGVLPVTPEQQLQADLKAAAEASLDKYHKTMAAAATTRANKPSAALGNGGDWRSRVVGHGVVQ